MICGFLDPEGTLYPCPRWGHTSKAEQIITELNIDRTSRFGTCEDELLKRGWICIRSSDVYKIAYDDNRNVLFITDKQQEFFENHKDEFNICQIVDIEKLLGDFGKLYEWHKNE